MFRLLRFSITIDSVLLVLVNVSRTTYVAMKEIAADFKVHFYDNDRTPPAPPISNIPIEVNLEVPVATTIDIVNGVGSSSVETSAHKQLETIAQDVSESNQSGSRSTALLESQDRTSSRATRRRPNFKLSFPVPDGLAMDPLAPTALAVSSEFMDRLGTGFSLLKDHGKKVQKYVWKNRKFDVLKKSWKSVVNVVLVEAKDLPNGPISGPNSVYCKFKLGNETHKSKQVTKTKPIWCERFNLYMYEDSNLEITVWHKGKQKNFMGRCIIDLSQLDKEKTHDLWNELECGYGTLHLLVTLNTTARQMPLDNVPTTHAAKQISPEEEKFAWYKLHDNWEEVGHVSVIVHGARGLSSLGLGGSVDSYCVLELDNARVQTHTVHGTSDPSWSKRFEFAISDITSALDLTIYDESIINTKGETIGKLSIPLLRIINDEKKWYALKDRAMKSTARGNCPRILLEMNVVWNPIKASARLLSPKETKYTQKPPKFSIPLIYSNLKFIKDIFNGIFITNEHLKRLFEWESRERSALALLAWLAFWYFFRLWMTPLLLLAPFTYYWIGSKNNQIYTTVPTYQSDEDASEDELESAKDEKSIKTRVYGLQDLTFTIKNGIDYIVSTLERLKNLAKFTVPYLSYLTMIVLVAAAMAFYFIPVNYIFMALGLYKFTRKILNPDRIPNNDILDFVSRVPDDELLKQWRELKVPEPSFSRSGSIRNSKRWRI